MNNTENTTSFKTVFKEDTSTKDVLPPKAKTEVTNEVPFSELNFEVYDLLEKKILKNIKLNSAIWNIKVNNQVIYDVIVSQQASQRQGTKKAKTRGKVQGGGKKPWRQKGTGRARHGSIRSPIWVGGGVTFGPTGEENYKRKVNRKVFRKGMQMILSNCLETNQIIFWNNQDLEKPSTKNFLEVLNKFEITKRKILLIIDENIHFNWHFAVKNLNFIKVIDYRKINPYDLVNARKILLFSQALETIDSRYTIGN